MAEGGGGAVIAVEKQKPHALSANGPWTLSDQGSFQPAASHSAKLPGTPALGAHLWEALGDAHSCFCLWGIPLPGVAGLSRAGAGPWRLVREMMQSAAC